MSIELVILFNHLILCCPLPLLPSVFHSIRVFSSDLSLQIKWPKYWSFSFSISPSNEYSGFISFRIDCSVLAWRIPGTGSLVGCRLWGHTESDTTKRRSSSSSGSSFVKPVESDGNSGWRQNRIVGHSIGVWRI